MILHNKQIHPQQRKLAVRAFHEFPIREESVEQHSNRHISSVECLFEHQSIHLIFWFRCVTRAPRFTVIHNTPIGCLRIYTSPFAYSINVCATVDSLFCHFTSYNSFSAARRAARGWKKVEKNKHRLTYTTQSLSFRSHFCCCFIAEDSPGLWNAWNLFSYFLACRFGFGEGGEREKIKSMRHHNSIFFFFLFSCSSQPPWERLFHHLGLHTTRWSHAVCKLIDYFETKSIFPRMEMNFCSFHETCFSLARLRTIFGHGEAKNEQTLSIFAIIYDKTNIFSRPYGGLSCIEMLVEKSSSRDGKCWRSWRLKLEE